ncbi:terminase small subunit [Pyramidobacter piscolens]|uniref:hypothetical protein n=1 Tax=Pyramidobacter piscolens TaxID=638849 RepID=UPI002AB197CD|nr:hypothetical protein [Pyramidobacter piscolens]
MPRERAVVVMALTEKQEIFCRELIKGATKADAYRAAYDCRRMKAATVRQRAKELADKPAVAARLEELRAPAVAEAQVTLTGHLNDLKDLRDEARRKGKYAAAVQAEIARGKASGLYVEKTELMGANGGQLMPGIIKIEYVNPPDKESDAGDG